MRHRISFECIPAGKRVLEKGLNSVFGVRMVGRWLRNAHQICHCPLPLKEYTHDETLVFSSPLSTPWCFSGVRDVEPSVLLSIRRQRHLRSVSASNCAEKARSVGYTL
jgi:hypothetical protein